jgi:putative FmdB family regulatory protein
MPTYDYRCEACGGFDAFRALGERNAPIACPGCGRVSPRVMSAAPRLALLDAATRTALATNERARHARGSTHGWRTRPAAAAARRASAARP